jgi:hypothetical protein
MTSNLTYRTCPQCAAQVRSGYKFCNSSCAAKYNNSKRVLSTETKAKIRTKAKANSENLKGINPFKLKYVKICIQCGDSFEGKPASKYCRKCSKHKEKSSIKIEQDDTYTCYNCNNSFNHYRFKKYCCDKCRFESVAAQKAVPDYTRVYLNECVYCGKPFYHKSNIKTCSVICKTASSSQRMSEWLRNPNNRKNYGRGKKSYLEQSFSDWLDTHGIQYECEVGFWNPELRKNYIVDFLFRNLNLIIELDGTQHKKTIEKDKIRDEYLSSIGYKILRITHKEYRLKTHMGLIKTLLM